MDRSVDTLSSRLERGLARMFERLLYSLVTERKRALVPRARRRSFARLDMRKVQPTDREAFLLEQRNDARRGVVQPALVQDREVNLHEHRAQPVTAQDRPETPQDLQLEALDIDLDQRRLFEP